MAKMPRVTQPKTIRARAGSQKIATTKDNNFFSNTEKIIQKRMLAISVYAKITRKYKVPMVENTLAKIFDFVKMSFYSKI
jgi:hypothetical protein